MFLCLLLGLRTNNSAVVTVWFKTRIHTSSCNHVVLLVFGSMLPHSLTFMLLTTWRSCSLTAWLSYCLQLDLDFTITFQRLVRILILFILLYLYDIGSPGYMQSNICLFIIISWLSFYFAFTILVLLAICQVKISWLSFYFNVMVLVLLAICQVTILRVAFVRSCPNAISFRSEF